MPQVLQYWCPVEYSVASDSLEQLAVLYRVVLVPRGLRPIVVRVMWMVMSVVRNGYGILGVIVPL